MQELENKSIGKRTGINFSNHEVIVTKTDDIMIHYLKKPNTQYDCIKFINTNGILAVTGDYGNWIFCREFHPYANGCASIGYWHEKLSILSTQNAKEYSSDETSAALKEMINGGAEEYGYTGERLQQALDYFNECLLNVDDELDYTHFAYRNYPSFMDTEEIIFCKDYKYLFKAICDGFDELCRREEHETINYH